MQIEGVYGARMTGGGFGGCMVALARRETSRHFETEIRHAYQEEFGITPDLYRCTPSDGAAEVKNFETIPPAGRLDSKST
jgi:galactokinase